MTSVRAGFQDHTLTSRPGLGDANHEDNSEELADDRYRLTVGGSWSRCGRWLSNHAPHNAQFKHKRELKLNLAAQVRALQSVFPNLLLNM
jgi:hypothetical protein